MTNNKRSLFALSMIIMLLSSTAFSQRTNKTVKPAPKAQDIIFAVLDDGRTIEPIARIENGKPVQFLNEESGESYGPAFIKEFYQPKKTYSLIFGGANSGKVSVKAVYTAECAGNAAEVSTTMQNGKLGGLVMALATNMSQKEAQKFFRRRPTAEERTEVEKLVRAEFLKHATTAKSIKELRYQNLTAIDVDGDGTAELVGSYWFAPNSKGRDLLFFIAEKNDSGKYALSVSDFEAYNPSNIMSGEGSDLDDGTYHTLFLDSFDYDGDGVGEIFVTKPAFEGQNYQIYHRENGKWTSVYESYNYRCGY